MTSVETPRQPQDFHHARLVVNDFDGTAAKTFEPSPEGYDVNVAYKMAIEAQDFDPKRIAQFYQEGGLKNRAPLEVAQFFAPDAEGDELLEISNHITDVKIGIILAKIGTRFPDGSMWPRPMPGFITFHKKVERARQDGRQIDDTVLSSGHELFISKAYEMWGIDQPTEIIATEKMQRLGRPHVIKPNSLLMSIAHSIWTESFGLSLSDVSPRAVRAQTIFIGDRDVDEQLAQKSGVKNFKRINEENSPQRWGETAEWLELKEDLDAE